MKKACIQLLTLLALSLPVSGYAQINMESVFLFDNSGSMRSLYEMPDLEFQRFLIDFVEKVTMGHKKISISLFSTSQNVIWAGSPTNLRENEDRIIHALDSDGRDTDIVRALYIASKTLTQKGHIWLITDNVNDPQGVSPEKNYWENMNFQVPFYAALKDSKYQLIYCFPLKYNNRGIVIYGIFFWNEGGRNRKYESEFTQTVTSARLESFLKRHGMLFDRAVFLHPLERGSIILLSPDSQQVDERGPYLKYFNGKIIGKGYKEGQPIEGQIDNFRIRSSLYPHTIQSATFADSIVGQCISTDKSCNQMVQGVTIVPDVILNLKPNEISKSTYSIRFAVPNGEPSYHFMDGLFRRKYQVKCHLMIKVRDTILTVPPSYLSSFKEVYNLEKLPTFFNPGKLSGITLEQVPIIVDVDYALWRLLLSLFLLFMIFVALCIPLIISFKKTYISISVDGYPVDRIVYRSFRLAKIEYPINNYNKICLGQFFGIGVGYILLAVDEYILSSTGKTWGFFWGSGFIVEMQTEDGNKSYSISVEKSE